jgi:hypothetical protein
VVLDKERSERINQMGFFVSRQRCYDLQKQLAIEIADGSKSAGKDILPFKFKGEGKNFLDPRDAVRNVLNIYKQWTGVGGTDEIVELHINHENGGKFFFDKKGIDYLNKWAEKMFSTLDKCGSCSGLLGKKAGINIDGLSGKFCDEYCASVKYRDVYRKELSLPKPVKK